MPASGNFALILRVKFASNVTAGARRRFGRGGGREYERQHEGT